MPDSATLPAVTEATFATAVVEASRTRPVVVDLWASWCGPCRQLTPMLEAAAHRWAGEVDVVAVDVDANPNLARSLGVQGIPAVKAFRDGRVVSEFTGVQPESALERFFAALAPSEADRLVSQAATAASGERAALLERALEVEHAHSGALVALARVRADEGDTDGAVALLDKVPGDAAGQVLRAELNLAAAGDGDADALRDRAQAGDGEAAVELGGLLAARGAHAEALEVLIGAVGDPDLRDAARSRILEVFAVLGEDHELVRTYRPKLAAALF